MKVNFYATLRQIVGKKTVEFTLPDGGTIGQLLDEATRQFPALGRELFDAQKSLYSHIHIFINGRDVPFLEEGLNTPLTTEDVISIFPAVGGGSVDSSRQ
jgi:MoaD family protein